MDYREISIDRITVDYDYTREKEIEQFFSRGNQRKDYLSKNPVHLTIDQALTWEFVNKSEFPCLAYVGFMNHDGDLEWKVEEVHGYIPTRECPIILADGCAEYAKIISPTGRALKQ